MTKPTLFGYGLTTKAIASSMGGGCTFFDDKTKETYIDEFGNTIKPSSLFDATLSDMEVTTPSLKPAHPLILSAKNLLSEYDYFLNPSEDKKLPYNIWISGTNGKTTTTQMVEHLLKKRGAVSGGNIGTPLANLDINAPIWILETSSFTLHHTKIASPNIYLLLPITPDHLDWHGDAQSYEADKLRPLLTMKEGELALIPKGLNLPQTSAFVVEYETSEDIASYFNIDTNKIRFKGAFLQDALIAMITTKVLFDELDYELMNSFVVDAHRQEEKTDHLGRLWVNDSKATNVDASLQALKVYNDRFIRLIIGGDDKGVDLNDLFAYISTQHIKLYSIGVNEPTVEALSKKYTIELEPCKTLDIAVEKISKEMNQNDVALLSPAAASLDQFTSYKHRGEVFFKSIDNLR
ncbi:MAG: UDP-N-acetylmuramoyl-L-alanyl-D-glutamate synthetase [Sulfurovum sp. AS07-7]|nr:MAG: UDP-N-acetylmuramoyl-L-alanyl-D-glutamate synthetase [Sulfurovum sp. AS07-7]